MLAGTWEACVTTALCALRAASEGPAALLAVTSTRSVAPRSTGTTV